jgi:hypothetical protein
MYCAGLMESSLFVKMCYVLKIGVRKLGLESGKEP